MPETAPTAATTATTTATTTVQDLAHEVRAKNAGPFWMTMEIFAKDADCYRVVADPAVIDEAVIARLYGVDPATIKLFRIPSLHVVKVAFPRPVSQGSLRDRDMHRGQQHVPLALLPVPSIPTPGPGA